MGNLSDINNFGFDKIKLYETKLYKEERRDSVFRNPFVFEGDDENAGNKSNLKIYVE